jgi:hypothetical protein
MTLRIADSDARADDSVADRTGRFMTISFFVLWTVLFFELFRL